MGEQLELPLSYPEETDVKKPIEVMDYCTIVSAKKMKGSGLEVGDVVMVTGTKDLPISKNDPYKKRTFVLAVKMMYNLPQIPKGDNDYKVWTIDPRNLERVSPEIKETFDAAIRNKYG